MFFAQHDHVSFSVTLRVLETPKRKKRAPAAQEADHHISSLGGNMVGQCWSWHRESGTHLGRLTSLSQYLVGPPW